MLDNYFDKISSVVDEINEKSKNGKTCDSKIVDFSKPKRKDGIDKEHANDLSRV